MRSGRPLLNRDGTGGEGLVFEATDAWRAAYPGAAAGFLLMSGVSNPAMSPALREHAGRVEAGLRERFGAGAAGAAAAGAAERAVAAALAEVPALQAYKRYYKAFGQNYHVQMQLESVLLKGKFLAAGTALVEAMFAAEVKNMLLTAGHDFAAVEPPVVVDVAQGGEQYEVFAGRTRTLKQGDMFMRDGGGFISSVLYGPDRRTKMTDGTGRVLFAVYAPPGVGATAVRAHLDEIASNVLLVAPEAHAEAAEVLEA